MKHRPDALVIGPMKAGTTWLHNYLEQQGNVCLPNGVKETFFFDRYYGKGIEWYESHFRNYDLIKHRRIMEIAPSYFHCEDAPERIRKELGDITLVVTLRDPIKRSWSHYLHLRRYGYTKSSLQEAAIAFPQLLGASRYYEVLQRWQTHFSPENIHVIWQEDLSANPESYARDLSRILVIPFGDLSQSAQSRSNEAAVPPSSILAALGRRTSYALRSLGLYGVVNFAKDLGLKKLFFGTPGKRALPNLTEADAQWLKEQLAMDYAMLPENLRHPDVLSL